MKTTSRRYTQKWFRNSLLIPLVGAALTTYLSTFIIGGGQQDVVMVSASNSGILPMQTVETEEEVAEESDTNPLEIAEATNLSTLKSVIDGWRLPEEIGRSVVVTDISTGETISSGSEGEYISASIYKLFVAYSILLSQQEGEIDLEDTAIGSFNIGDCLEVMITVSDEECGIELGWLAGWSTVDQQLANIELNDTTINNYNANRSFNGDKFTTAVDVDKFLTELYRGELLGAAQTDYLLELMGRQEINDRIPEELPVGVRIAHKTGNLYDHVHDVGYIELSSGGIYSFTILTNGWEDQLESSDYFVDLIDGITEELAS